jgi:hypothetical protein
MIWWLLLWLGGDTGGAGPPADTTPGFKRDGRDVTSIPVFRRRG